MTKNEKQAQIQVLKKEANAAKSKLLRIMDELRDIGALREANGIETVIAKLEAWQNR